MSSRADDASTLQTAEDEQTFLARMQLQLQHIQTPSPGDGSSLSKLATDTNSAPPIGGLASNSSGGGGSAGSGSTPSSTLTDKEAVLSSFFNSLLTRKNLSCENSPSSSPAPPSTISSRQSAMLRKLSATSKTAGGSGDPIGKRIASPEPTSEKEKKKDPETHKSVPLETKSPVDVTELSDTRNEIFPMKNKPDPIQPGTLACGDESLPKNEAKLYIAPGTGSESMVETNTSKLSSDALSAKDRQECEQTAKLLKPSVSKQPRNESNKELISETDLLKATPISLPDQTRPDIQEGLAKGSECQTDELQNIRAMEDAAPGIISEMQSPTCELVSVENSKETAKTDELKEEGELTIENQETIGPLEVAEVGQKSKSKSVTGVEEKSLQVKENDCPENENRSEKQCPFNESHKTEQCAPNEEHTLHNTTEYIDAGNREGQTEESKLHIHTVGKPPAEDVDSEPNAVKNTDVEDSTVVRSDTIDAEALDSKVSVPKTKEDKAVLERSSMEKGEVKNNRAKFMEKSPSQVSLVQSEHKEIPENVSSADKQMHESKTAKTEEMDHGEEQVELDRYEQDAKPTAFASVPCKSPESSSENNLTEGEKDDRSQGTAKAVDNKELTQDTKVENKKLKSTVIFTQSKSTAELKISDAKESQQVTQDEQSPHAQSFGKDSDRESIEKKN
ncbi:unnamed protein product [Echinostoma caproni]|uniref:CAP-ZIP_m domain-containing protein n=1 Tax=Echinostoma caproni TaxID=27848 RepID=A0A183AEF3_9TREM|nr:unnamed protein product [Echinostoma caproni]